MVREKEQSSLVLLFPYNPWGCFPIQVPSEVLGLFKRVDLTPWKHWLPTNIVDLINPRDTSNSIPSPIHFSLNHETTMITGRTDYQDPLKLIQGTLLTHRHISADFPRDLHSWRVRSQVGLCRGRQEYAVTLRLVFYHRIDLVKLMTMLSVLDLVTDGDVPLIYV